MGGVHDGVALTEEASVVIIQVPSSTGSTEQEELKTDDA